MSEEMQTEDIEQQGISTFYYTVAGYNILLESGVKTEIIEKRTIFPIPHTPIWCRGMISLRGKLIPVANLHHLLSTPEPEILQWLLVLEKAPFPPLAICIDQLPMQQLINDEPRTKVNNGLLPTWIQASIHVDNKVFYDANHTEFFEQLIQENETPQANLQEKPNTPIKAHQETTI